MEKNLQIFGGTKSARYEQRIEIARLEITQRVDIASRDSCRLDEYVSIERFCLFYLVFVCVFC